MAGIGCHSLRLGMPASQTMFMVQMGGEGSNWLGAAPFVRREHVFQNLGDGTYGHSGSLAVRAAVAAGARIVGVNNRDLRTFQVRLETTLDLLPRIPRERLVITESGIHAAADVARMRSRGVDAFLVGEAFMRAPDPGAALRTMFAVG
jgi:hypothetical protein